MIEITIPGNPIAKKRPRFVRRTGHAFNSQTTEEGLVILELKRHIDKPFDFPISISFEFNIARPKSHFGTGKNAKKLKSSVPGLPTGKPDIDNLIKFYMDCMNNIVYYDDAIVLKVQAIKQYVFLNEANTFISIERFT